MTGHGRSLALATTTSAVLVLLLAGLLVQHLRHGWPFSLHHGMSVEFSSRSRAPGGDEPHPVTHARIAVAVPADQLASLGIRTERVVRETVARPIRAVATVVPDESRVSHVHTRVAGWIDVLHVRTTGERVRAGQPLAGIFSQELLSSQAEYLAARRAAAAGQRSVVVDGARNRLRVLGMTDAEIRAIEETGQPRQLVTVVAPRGGIVLRRGVSAGMAVDPSTELFTIADLSRVWVLAEIPEIDVPYVQKGSQAELEFPGSGQPRFTAQVDFLYPTLSERTRTLKVRFVVDSSSGALRPGLYGTAEFRVVPREALTISRDAVVDTGVEQHVFVATQGGRFEPRPVQLGVRLQDRVEVRTGLAEGEAVAASGVFLIDSESRLQASGSVGHVGHGSPQEPAGKAPARDRRGHEGH